MAAGTDLGLVNAGYRAIESCRLEKGYRAWGSDIGPDHTPFEAGLGWAVKLKRDTTFSVATRCLPNNRPGFANDWPVSASTRRSYCWAAKRSSVTANESAG